MNRRIIRWKPLKIFRLFFCENDGKCSKIDSLTHTSFNVKNIIKEPLYTYKNYYCNALKKKYFTNHLCCKFINTMNTWTKCQWYRKTKYQWVQNYCLITYYIKYRKYVLEKYIAHYRRSSLWSFYYTYEWDNKTKIICNACVFLRTRFFSEILFILFLTPLNNNIGVWVL